MPLEPLRPKADLPWITGRLDNGTPVCLGTPDDLPPEAASDRAVLQRLGIRSIGSLPLVLGGAPVGWLMFSTLRENRSWPTIEQLRRIAEIAGERRRPTESLRETERTHIVEVLDRCRWTIEGRGQAADRLGLNPSTLRNRMRKLGTKRPPR